MEEEKYQKELFQFDKPKRSFSRLTDILPKADFEGRVAITISLEKMVFIAIGIVMVMVVVYALGVESGRSRAKVPDERVMKPPALSPSIQPVPVRATVIPARNILNTAPVVPAVRPAPPIGQTYQNQVKTVPVNQESKSFTILAGTFTSRQNAQTARTILAGQGFDNVTVTYSQPYYRVCVGVYTDKSGAEAQKDLIRVRHVYKDATLKLK